MNPPSWRSVLHRIPRRISLAGLLLLTTVLSLGAADIVMHRREEREFRSLLLQLESETIKVTEVSIERRWPRFWRTRVLIRSVATYEDAPFDLLRSIPTLRGIQFWRDITMADFDQLVQMPNIERLILPGMWSTGGLPNSQLTRLRNLPRLTHLSLNDHSISNASTPILESLTSLEVLSVEGTRITLERLSKMRLPRLRSLDAAGLHGKVLDLTPDGFGGMPGLTALGLLGASFDELKVDAGRPMSRITDLDLRLLFSRPELDGLANAIPSIQKLCLPADRLSSSVCTQLATLPSLETLAIADRCFDPDCEPADLGRVSVNVHAAQRKEIEQAVRSLLASRRDVQITDQAAHREVVTFNRPPKYGGSTGPHESIERNYEAPLPEKYWPRPSYAQPGSGLF